MEDELRIDGGMLSIDRACIKDRWTMYWGNMDVRRAVWGRVK